MRRLTPIALIPGLCSFALIAGCNRFHGFAHSNTTNKVAIAKPSAPTPPQIDYQKVRPNELGRIPVIMYHEIGFGKTLTRSIASFKEDLRLMYDAGFRPVNLSDVINDNIDVPAGKSPIVLTFDDSRASQFKLIETTDKLKVDPNCAVGILEEFHKQHPDWQMRATFFVLPKSKLTQEVFGQRGLGTQKMEYLLDQGMEIGNHTTLHKNMQRMTPEQIQSEIGNANNFFMEALPKAKFQVFALPMGKYPFNKKNAGYLLKGTYQGKPYQFKAVMLAAYRPIPSPAAKAFNPLRLERIDCVDGLNGVRFWIKQLTTSEGRYARYVSDGDPNTISFPKDVTDEANLAKLKAQHKLVNPYLPFNGEGGAKPIISAVDNAKPEAAPNRASAEKPLPQVTTAPKPIVGG